MRRYEMNLSEYTVMIAEDDAMSYKFLELVLTKKTCINIIWAINGQQAVDFCRIYNHIDIILMDIQLPLIDGFEAVKRIKKLKPEIPIIVQSANSYNDEWQTSIELGCDAYLTKPVNANKLIEQIESLLKSAVSKSA